MHKFGSVLKCLTPIFCIVYLAWRVPPYHQLYLRKTTAVYNAPWILSFVWNSHNLWNWIYANHSYMIQFHKCAKKPTRLRVFIKMYCALSRQAIIVVGVNSKNLKHGISPNNCNLALNIEKKFISKCANYCLGFITARRAVVQRRRGNFSKKGWALSKF